MSNGAQSLRQALSKHTGTPEGWQSLVDDYVALGSVCSSYVPKLNRTCYTVKQIPVEVYAPATPTTRSVLFLHGGHYWLPVVDFYRAVAEQVAQSSGCNVVLVDYAVQPYVYPSALRQVITVWNWLTQHTSEVSVLGDGSGAQLALQLALYVRNNVLTAPGALALVSPWADLTASGDSYYDNFYLDPVLGRRRLGGMDIPHAYRVSPLVAHFAGQDLSSPELSPLFADLSGLPPCYLAVGEHEVLLSDATRLFQTLQKAGVRSHLTVGNSMFHIYPFYWDKCPESKEGLAGICSFLRTPPETPSVS